MMEYRGSRDLFTSSRIYFNRCPYWCVDEKWLEIHPNELVIKKHPTGYFNAKEENPMRTGNQIVGGAFMFETNNLTISTEDDVYDLKENDILKFRGEIYRITDIQRQPRLKQTQYSDRPSCKTIMTLKR
jgi:hypothetical protein